MQCGQNTAYNEENLGIQKIASTKISYVVKHAKNIFACFTTYEILVDHFYMPKFIVCSKISLLYACHIITLDISKVMIRHTDKILI